MKTYSSSVINFLQKENSILAKVLRQVQKEKPSSASRIVRHQQKRRFSKAG